MTIDRHLTELYIFREAVASVSLSHDEDCNCLTCRAGKGDEKALMLLWTSLHGQWQD